MKVHEVDVHPALPERIAWLGEIARNVWSSWSPEAGDLFSRLDPEAWERLEPQPGRAAARPAAGDARRRGGRRELRGDGGPGRAPPRRLRLRARAGCVPPIAEAAGHAGGLLLARVRPRRRHPALLGRPRHPGRRPPEVGVRPRRAAGGRGPALPQRLLPPVARPRRRPARALPGHRLVGPAALRPDRRPDGSPVVVEVEIGEETVRAAVRTIQVGRVPLLLLDADVEGNSPEAAPDHRAPSTAATASMRIRQEILLGVGGVRALAAAGMSPDGLPHERGPLGAARRWSGCAALIEDGGLDARRGPRAGRRLDGLHHPHPGAGGQRDLRARARAHATSSRSPAAIGMTWDELAALASHPDEGEHRLRHDARSRCAPPASPTASPRCTATRRGACGAGSGPTCRSTRCRSPASPTASTPRAGSAARCTSCSTATSARRCASARRTRRCGTAPRRIPAGELWRVHELRRERLVLFARERLRASCPARARGASASRAAGDALRPDALTICFARRFATYKRADLLFRDPERLARLLGDEKPPGAADRGRQGPPARRARQGACCAPWSRSRSARACATGSCSSRTTTCTSRATWCRAPTCGSTCRAARSRPRAPAA